MEPEGSLPHLRASTTGPFSEPDQSRTRLPILLLEDQFLLILSSRLRLALPHISPPKSCVHVSCLPFVPHALPIAFSLISSARWHLVMNTYHKAPRYAVFSTPLLTCPSQVLISSSAPYSGTPSSYVEKISPGPCEMFRNIGFIVRSCKHLGQLQSWRAAPCRLPAAAYSIYLQLPSILQAVPPSASWVHAMPWWQRPTCHGVFVNVCNIRFFCPLFLFCFVVNILVA